MHSTVVNYIVVALKCEGGKEGEIDCEIELEILWWVLCCEGLKWKSGTTSITVNYLHLSLLLTNSTRHGLSGVISHSLTTQTLNI